MLDDNDGLIRSLRQVLRPWQYEIDKHVFIDWKAGTPPADHETFTLPSDHGRQSFILLRHGETSLNAKDASKDSAERVRGWADVPLDAHGREQLVEIAKEFKNIKVDVIYSSDLVRASETAHAVGRATGVPVRLTRGLRPWDLGHFTGHETKRVAPIMVNLIMNRPNEKIPGGESFNAFKSRAQMEVEKILSMHPKQSILMVSHHRVERLCAAWEAKQKSATRAPQPVGPGGRSRNANDTEN